MNMIAKRFSLLKLLLCCILSFGLLLPALVCVQPVSAAGATNSYSTAAKQRIGEKYAGLVSDETLQALQSADTAESGNAAAETVLEEAKGNKLFTFAVMSDVHMNVDGHGDATPNGAPGDTDVQFQNALNGLYRTFPETQLLIVDGDITCNGMEAEYQKYLMPILNYDIPVLTAIGNHEYRINETIDGVSYSRDSRDPEELERLSALTQTRFLDTINEYFENKGMPTTDKVYYDRYYGGYHFILLGSEARTNDTSTTKVMGEASVISDEQIAWLREKLAETDPDQPVFVMTHNPLNNTVTESEDYRWGLGAEASEQIKEVLADYPQAIVISGHVHNGYIGDEATVVTSYGTFLDLPAFEYNVFDNIANDIGYIADIYDGCVLFTPYDFTNERPLYEGIVRVDRAVSETLATAYDKDGTAAPDGNGSMILDLQGETKVDGLRVIPADGETLLSYKVEISSDNVTYTTIAEGTFLNDPATNNVFGSDTDSLTNKIFFDKIYTTRYIRYTTTEGTCEQPTLCATFLGEDMSELRALYRSILTAGEQKSEALAAAMAQAKSVIENRDSDAETIAAALQALQSASGTDTPQSPADNTALIVGLSVAAAVVVIAAVTAVILIKKKKSASKKED